MFYGFFFRGVNHVWSVSEGSGRFFLFFFPLSLGVCALIVLSVATLMTHRGSLFSVFPAAARADKFSLIFLTTFITAATSAAVPVLWVLSPPRPLSLPSMPSIIPHPPPDVFFTLSPTSRPRRLDVVSEHLNSQEPRITLNSSDVGATLDSERKGNRLMWRLFLSPVVGRSGLSG